MHAVIRRVVRGSLWVIGGILTLSAIGVALLAWRLSTGPMPLGFLTPYLEQALTASLVGYQIELQDTHLAWDVEARNLDLRAYRVTVRESNGRVLATLPAMSVALSLQALWHGTVALTAVDLRDAHVTLIRRPDGPVRFGIPAADAAQPQGEAVREGEDAKKAKSASEVVTELVAALMADPNPSRPLAYLRQVRVVNSAFTVYDPQLRRSWEAPTSHLVLRRHRQGLAGEFRAQIAVSQTAIDVDAVMAYDPSTGQLEGDATVANVQPAALATMTPALDVLRGLDVPLQGTLGLKLDLQDMRYEFRVEITGGPDHLTWPDVLPKPLPVAQMAVQGRVEIGKGAVHLDQAMIEMGEAGGRGPKVSVSGGATGLGGDLTATGRVRLQAMPLAHVQHYWPLGVSPEARTWITQNLVAGTVE